MRHGCLDYNDGKFRRLNSLAAPLTEIERRRGVAREQNQNAFVSDDGAAPLF
jgi:hypothetical protein